MGNKNFQKIYTYFENFKDINNIKKLFIIGPCQHPTQININDFIKINNITVNNPWVAIDGGIEQLKTIKNIKNYNYLSIGDGDSLKDKTNIKKINILLPREKDYSDLSYLLKILIKIKKIKNININNIYLYGFVGERRDHELVNLGELYFFLKNYNHKIKIFLEDKIIGFSAGYSEIDIYNNKLFSVIAIEKTRFKISGECRYSLNKFIKLKPLSSLALSNEGWGRIQIEHNRPVFIIYSQIGQD